MICGYSSIRNPKVSFAYDTVNFKPRNLVRLSRQACWEYQSMVEWQKETTKNSFPLERNSYQQQRQKAGRPSGRHSYKDLLGRNFFVMLLYAAITISQRGAWLNAVILLYRSRESPYSFMYFSAFVSIQQQPYCHSTLRYLMLWNIVFM
jgi:hypothetical protein